jgi:hypothetical protein
MEKNLNLFCYGSNSVKQLKERLEIEENISFQKAYIKDYVRIFCGYSKRWNGGVSSIYPLKGKNIYGILININIEDLEKISKFEKGYHLEIKDVSVEDIIIKSFVFIKNDIKFNELPSKEYMLAINDMLNDRNNEIKDRKILIRSIIDNKIKIISIWQ